MSWWEGLKDELGWSVEDAAREEINQTKRKGYNTDEGTINRGFFENLRDNVLGNDREAIEKRARELHIEKLQLNNPTYRRLNTQLKNLGETERVEIGATTTQAALSEQLDRLNQAVPILQGIDAKQGSREGLSTHSSIGTLTGALDEAGVQQERDRYESAPQVIEERERYHAGLRRSDNLLAANMAMQSGQLALSNKRADNQMELAQMQQQLQMRREDSADRRADRRDRQAMIQQMMAGLSTLGASIAI